MTLALTAARGSVTFTYTDDNMTASWTVKAEDGEEKLISTMKKVITFVEGEEERPELPRRTPGLALEMTQMTSPRPPGNGWAAMAPPDIPERLQGEVEMIGEGEPE